MCARYTLHQWEIEGIARRFHIDAYSIEEMRSIRPRYNVAPTQQVLGIQAGDDGLPRFAFYRWGLIRSWAKDLKFQPVNARDDNLGKGLFGGLLASKRCVILADGFYEWPKSGGKKVKGTPPWYLQVNGGRVFAMAGLWDTWRSPDGEVVTSATIITTGPNELIAEFHDRSPVILDDPAAGDWLNPQLRDTQALAAYLEPWPAGRMSRRRVSAVVNNSRIDGPECLEAAEA